MIFYILPQEMLHGFTAYPVINRNQIEIIIRRNRKKKKKAKLNSVA
jgi:hypothetical protein